MVYHFKYHKEGNGYWAQGIELDGCVTQGDSMPELLENLSEVLNLFLSEPYDSTHEFPEPKNKVAGRNILVVQVDPAVAFVLLLKKARKKRNMTQRAAADALDMQNIYSYQSLESPKKANPELKTLAKLKTVFPELDLEQVFKKAK